MKIKNGGCTTCVNGYPSWKMAPSLERTYNCRNCRAENFRLTRYSPADIPFWRGFFVVGTYQNTCTFWVVGMITWPVVAPLRWILRHAR